jgi:hypothetical protein
LYGKMCRKTLFFFLLEGWVKLWSAAAPPRGLW